MPLTNLGNALLARYEWGGDVTDLNAAIEADRQALIHTPSGHPNRAMYLSNLGNALAMRFEVGGDDEDLATAVDVGQQSVADTPPDHPDLARRLTILGGILLARFGQSRQGNGPWPLTRLVIPISPRCYRTSRALSLPGLSKMGSVRIWTPPSTPPSERWL